MKPLLHITVFSLSFLRLPCSLTLNRFPTFPLRDPPAVSRNSYLRFCSTLFLLAFILLSIKIFSQEIPMQEMTGKKPMKIDSALKGRAVKVKVRQRSGTSTSMLHYNYDEYTMVEVRQKPSYIEQNYGFKGNYNPKDYPRKDTRKSEFTYMLTEHQDDTARISSVLVMPREYTRQYRFFGWLTEYQRIEKSTNIYTSQMQLSTDTAGWVIVMKDSIKYNEAFKTSVTGDITNGLRRLLIRQVAEFDNGEMAKFMPPGFEILEDGKALLAIQFIGESTQLPIIWIDPGIDHQSRFILLAAASSLVARINEQNSLKMMGKD